MRPDDDGGSSRTVTLDHTELLGAAHAERERLGRTIQFTPPEAWEAESTCPGWRNRDVMAHLAAQETAAAEVLAGEPAAEFEEFRDAQDPPDFWVDGFNEWAAVRRKDLPYRQVVMEWGRGADRLLVNASRLADEEWGQRRVPWVVGEIGVRYLIQSRIVEWWLHGLDIRRSAELGENVQHWPIFLTNDFSTWEATGSPSTAQQANAVWKKMLKEYQAPPLDPGIKEELYAFAEQRRTELRERKPRTEWQR